MADGKTAAAQRLSGTPAFTAPELVAGSGGGGGGEGGGGADPFAADVWAMGACLYCFIYGQLPFQVRRAVGAGGGHLTVWRRRTAAVHPCGVDLADTHARPCPDPRCPSQGGSVLDIFKAITSAPLQLPPAVPVSPALSDLLHRLFEKDPGRRITVAGIMEHPWVTDGGQLRLSQLPPPAAAACAAGGDSSSGGGNAAAQAGAAGGAAGPGGWFGEIEVTAAEAHGAIDRASAVSMIRARLKEKAFQPGEHLLREVRGR